MRSMRPDRGTDSRNSNAGADDAEDSYPSAMLISFTDHEHDHVSRFLAGAGPVTFLKGSTFHRLHWKDVVAPTW